MARSRVNRPIRAPSASRQVAFHQLLVAARKTWLHDALSSALKSVDPNLLKQQLATFAPPDAQQILASAGIRDEHVFPTPAVLEKAPALVGYYRLLLGVPRKGFYKSATGMGVFASMERLGTLTEAKKLRLPEFCLAMGQELANLVRQISPQISKRDIAELPLLTLGSMLQGANNVKIGEEAKQNVFIAVRELVKSFITKQTSATITLRNAAGRDVMISFGSDPDICVQEMVGQSTQNKVAIEIKGGADLSNAHNRAGEAEKSHQKAKRKQYRDFWTLLARKGLDRQKLQDESPTTTWWFDIAQVLARDGEDWMEFERQLASSVGIPLRN